MNRIDALFGRLAAEGRSALMPFVTAGDPDLATTAEVIRAIVAGGADMVELGIPYSDPIADGPVISESYTRALNRGIKLSAIFDTIAELRISDEVTPIVAMVSYAIIHKHGVEQFLKRAAEVGFDGLIVPDLPVEESERLAEWASGVKLALIQLITPTTPRDRAVRIAKATTGFIYYVSVAGITGERKALPPDLLETLAWLRTQTKLPICVGFGVGTPDQIKELAPFADGLIVGSAIVRRFAEDRPKEQLAAEISRFVAELAAPLRTR